MPTFESLREALEYTVEHSVSAGHNYILSVRGPREIRYNQACCFQVVAETMAYRNGQCGLTIHLPFDPTGGVSDELLRFLECPLRYYFDKSVWSGIPCFTLRCGENVNKAERVMALLLTDVFGYTTATEFECEVSDEGPQDEEQEDDESEEGDKVAGSGRDDDGQNGRTPAPGAKRKRRAARKGE